MVLHPDFRRAEAGEGSRSAEARLHEAVGLARAVALEIAGQAVVPVVKPKPSTLFGSGQIERETERITADNIGVVIVDTALSPVQQRNLEKAWKAKVVDRTALILEIFGARARTHEGKLQVELAALEYQKSRLVRSWTHLERQRGGFGFLGGPGESQIELDRRMIRDRIILIKEALEKVMRTRSLHRKVRRDVPFPTVALVGYTNAGKSTLFNALTNAGILAADALFATLDPTIRRVRLPDGLEIILSDTVGFISNLPTELVAAFRATLEEVVEADLLLHVRDLSHADSNAQKKDVERVLKQLFGNGEMPPVIEVRNKVDLMPDVAYEPGNARSIPVSASRGIGIDRLEEAVSAELSDRFLGTRDYRLPIGSGDLVAWLYRHAQIVERRDDEKRSYVRVRISPANAVRFGRMLERTD